MSKPAAPHDLTQESLVVLSRHAKSFRWASLFLPASARADTAILYAFCRRLDDVVDESTSQNAAEAGLNEMEADLHKEEPSDPLIARFRQIALARGFGLEPAADLIRGMRSDLGPVRVRSWQELELYCYRVAGTVGLMMARLLGTTHPEAQRHAVSLGIAMQLTNICRDVGEDLARRRVYLPEEELTHHDGSQAALARVDAPAPVVPIIRTVRALLSRAEELYVDASHGFSMIPGRGRLAVLIAALLYREIGRKLVSRQASNPLLGRVIVSPLRKLALLTEALLRLLVGRTILSKRTFTIDGIEESPEDLYTAPRLRLPSP